MSHTKKKTYTESVKNKVLPDVNKEQQKKHQLKEADSDTE